MNRLARRGDSPRLVDPQQPLDDPILVRSPRELAAAMSLARGKSVCSHLVAKNDVEVIEDLLRDRRFAGDSMLRENGLRFYAGAPLRAPDGQPIGTLCVMDTAPRAFSKKQRGKFLDYATRVSARIIATGKNDAYESETANDRIRGDAD